MEKAVKAYREAVKTGDGLGSNGEVLFHLAVALEVSSFVFYVTKLWVLLFLPYPFCYSAAGGDGRIRTYHGSIETR